MRIERDRRGGLRVFQGPALQGGRRRSQSAARTCRSRTSKTTENQPVESTQRRPCRCSDEPADGELETIEPMPIDTTAELLGRAKPRKPRARAPRAGAGGGAEESRREKAGGARSRARKKAASQSRRRRQPVDRRIRETAVTVSWSYFSVSRYRSTA